MDRDIFLWFLVKTSFHIPQQIFFILGCKRINTSLCVKDLKVSQKLGLNCESNSFYLFTSLWFSVFLPPHMI